MNTRKELANAVGVLALGIEQGRLNATQGECEALKGVVRMELTSEYFKAPNSLFERPLSPKAKLVYLFLLRRADRHGFCYPSVRDIAIHCGYGSRQTVFKALDELERENMIERSARFKRDNARTSNGYRIT